MKLYFLFFLFLFVSGCQTNKDTVTKIDTSANSFIDVPDYAYSNSKWSAELNLMVKEIGKCKDVLQFTEWTENQPYVIGVGCDIENNSSFKPSKGKCFDVIVDFVTNEKNWTTYFIFSYNIETESISLIEYKGYGSETKK